MKNAKDLYHRAKGLFWFLVILLFTIVAYLWYVSQARKVGTEINHPVDSVKPIGYTPVDAFRYYRDKYFSKKV